MGDNDDSNYDGGFMDDVGMVQQLLGDRRLLKIVIAVFIASVILYVLIDRYYPTVGENGELESNFDGIAPHERNDILPKLYYAAGNLSTVGTSINPKTNISRMGTIAQMVGTVGMAVYAINGVKQAVGKEVLDSPTDTLQQSKKLRKQKLRRLSPPTRPPRPLDLESSGYSSDIDWKESSGSELSEGESSGSELIVPVRNSPSLRE